MSLPAGLARMPLARFCALTALGSAIWNALLVAAGWLLADQYRRVADVLGPVSTVVVVAALGALVIAVVVGVRRHTRELRPAFRAGDRRGSAPRSAARRSVAPR